MEIDKYLAPWLIAALKDDSRVVLQHLLIERVKDEDSYKEHAVGIYNATVTATNGYAMVKTFCHLEDDEPEGLVRADAFPMAQKALKSERDFTRLKLTDETIILGDGSTLPRFLPGLVRDDPKYPPRFPNYNRVVPERPYVEDMVGYPICFSPVMFGLVSKALGAVRQYEDGIYLTVQNDPAGPMIIERVRRKEERPVPPFGILMPMFNQGKGVEGFRTRGQQGLRT